jgi:hypothetical protein
MRGLGNRPSQTQMALWTYRCDCGHTENKTEDPGWEKQTPCPKCGKLMARYPGSVGPKQPRGHQKKYSRGDIKALMEGTYGDA